MAPHRMPQPTGTGAGNREVRPIPQARPTPWLSCGPSPDLPLIERSLVCAHGGLDGPASGGKHFYFLSTKATTVRNGKTGA